MSKPTPMEVAAGRALCKLSSDSCGVDNEDNWKLYGESFIEDGKAALDAAGVPDLLKALKAVISGCEFKTIQGESGWHIKSIASNEALDLARAAIAKAEGS